MESHVRYFSPTLISLGLSKVLTFTMSSFSIQEQSELEVAIGRIASGPSVGLGLGCDMVSTGLEKAYLNPELTA